MNSEQNFHFKIELNSNSKTNKTKTINKKGLMAFFQKSNEIEILYKSEIVLLQEFLKFPDSLKILRNTLIYLITWQIIASFFAMMYILIRRSYLYFLINIFSISLACIGLKGIIQMKAKFLIFHCLFTTSITGGFFFFQIIDFLLVADTTHGKEKRLNDSVLLIIFSLPYLYDTYVGISCYSFLSKVTKLIEETRQIEMPLELELEDIDQKEVEHHVSEEKLCIICCEQERTAVLNPCGHLVCCLNCANLILKKNSFTSY